MEEHVIKILVDRDKDMSIVLVDDQKIMQGSFLDFNNKNLGTDEYGDFLGFESLAIRIMKKLSSEGRKSCIIKEKFKFEG